MTRKYNYVNLYSRLGATAWLMTLLFTTMILPEKSIRAADMRQSYLWLNASAEEFKGWQLDGLQIANQGLQLDPAHLKSGRDPNGAGGYQGGNYYNGGQYSYGEAVGPYYSPANGFDSAVVSWNAQTPAGTWVELRIRALVGQHWTREYVMGIWTSDNGTVKRHSRDGQADNDGQVLTDTLLLKQRASAFQVRALLFSANPPATPYLSLVAVSAVHDGANPYLAPDKSAWGRELNVPERSQQLYSAGADEWCSPTSDSMALAYWAATANRSATDQTVPTAATRTYDWIYKGNGNWPFNTAFVAAAGGGTLESYVTRLLSLSQVESWIGKGVPVITSISFQPGQLDGTPIPQSGGHLVLIRGFDRAGNVVTNDPAADPRKGQPVRTVYNRAQFEQRWLEASGGMAYLIYPQGWNIPSNQRGTSWAATISERLGAFGDAAIETIWANADRAVAAGSAGRGWLWGPQPRTAARLENYTEGPNGMRLVQYFDKSRMEITRPQGDRSSQWFVTNGLLTVELVTGQIQQGDTSFRATNPAQIPVAGDADSPLAPTYATFRGLASVEGKQAERRASNRVGQAVTATLNRNGQTGQTSPNGVTIASYENTLGHNIPNVFWGWMNDPARSGLNQGWLYALGYPISEAYWVQVNLSGKPTMVLVQLFERRALTYAPNNPAAFQVEMGNIGLHYLTWRYS